MKRLAKKREAAKRAKLRIRELFQDAEESFPNESAHRSVRKARRLAMKHRLRLPTEWRRRYCRHCYAFLKPGTNARVRIHKGKVVLFCKECQKFWRMPLRK